MSTDQEILGWAETLQAFGADTPFFPGVRFAGSAQDNLATAWLADELTRLGLESVRRETFPLKGWAPSEAELLLHDRDGSEIPIEAWPIYYTRFTTRRSSRGRLLWIGWDGSGLAGGEADGRIVVAELLSPVIPALEYDALRAAAADVHDPDEAIPREGGHRFWHFVNQRLYRAAQEAGALGFIGVTVNKPRGGRFYPNANQIVSDVTTLEPGSLPGVFVDARDGERLRLAAEDGGEASLTTLGTMPETQGYNVLGLLPGRTERILQVTSHSDGGAVNDATGAAEVLALASYFARRRATGETLRHTLQFVLTGGHFAATAGIRAYREAHRDDLMPLTAASVTIEHVGKHFELQQGELLDSGRPDLIALVSSRSEWIPMLGEAVRARDLGPAFIFPITAEVARDSGEGWTWHSYGLPSVWHVTGVQYMQSTLDSMDKVAVSELARVASVLRDVILELDLRMGE